MKSVFWLSLCSAPLAATFAFFGHAFATQLLRPLNQDVGWLFFVAKSLVAGERLYGDFSEENPPLILWLYSVPAWFASALDISGIVCLRLFVLLAAALSLYLLNRLLKQRMGPDGETSYKAGGNADTPVVRHALICAIGYLLTVFPDGSFGQREHLIAMGLVPYVAAMAFRLCCGLRNPLPLFLTIGVGVSAGLAISLKPVYLPAILAPELYLIWRERSISSLVRPEMMTLIVVGIGYLLSVPIFAPEYFEVILPLALDCYWAYQEPLSAVFGFEHPAYLAVSFLLAKLGMPKANRRLRALANVFFLSGSGCYLAYLMGQTSWTYHLLPVWVAIFSLVSLAVLGAVQRLVARALVELPPTPPTPQTPPALGLAAGAVLLAVVGLVLVDRPVLRSAAQVLARDGDYLTLRNTVDRDLLRLQKFVLANTSSQRSVHILSPLMTPAFPLVNHADLDWTSRFASPWVLPAAAYARAGHPRGDLDAARIEEIEEYFIRSTLDDMTRYKPELVLVEVGRDLPRFRGLGLNFLRMLARDERFDAFWRGYRRTGSVRYHGRHFAAYRRDSSAAESQRRR